MAALIMAVITMSIAASIYPDDVANALRIHPESNVTVGQALGRAYPQATPVIENEPEQTQQLMEECILC